MIKRGPTLSISGMKGQYFGDINDYRKYGLLRALQSSGEGSLLVAWMLTPDDGRPDGNFMRAKSEFPRLMRVHLIIGRWL